VAVDVDPIVDLDVNLRGLTRSTCKVNDRVDVNVDVDVEVWVEVIVEDHISLPGKVGLSADDF